MYTGIYFLSHYFVSNSVSVGLLLFLQVRSYITPYKD